MSESVTRRAFLGASVAGVGLSTRANAANRVRPGKAGSPREVWVATLSLENLQAQSCSSMVDQMLDRMEQTLPCGPDLICLPETFPYYHVPDPPSMNERAEIVPGPIVSRFAAFAKENRCYVICPLNTRSHNRVYNSAVMLDRDGKVAGQYHKIHPTVSEMTAGVLPGPLDPPVFETDFGTIGVQICFDVNWPDGWHRLRAAGAEIVFWPSAFPGGRMLNSMASMHKYYVVTSTWENPSRIIDLTGDEISSTGRYDNWACAPLNLERKVVHTWPYVKQIESLRAKYGRQVRVTRLHDEGWSIVESISPNLRIADALADFGIPLHVEHIAMGDRMQCERRPT